MIFSTLLVALLFISSNSLVTAESLCPTAKSSPAFQKTRDAYNSFRQSSSLGIASMFFQQELHDNYVVASRMHMFTAVSLIDQAKLAARTDDVVSRGNYFLEKLQGLRFKIVFSKQMAKHGAPSVPSLKNKLNKKNSIWFNIGKKIKDVLQSEVPVQGDNRAVVGPDEIDDEEVEPGLLDFAERIGRLFNKDMNDVNAALIEIENKKFC